MPHEESAPVATRSAPNNNDLIDSLAGGGLSVTSSAPAWQRTGGTKTVYGRRRPLGVSTPSVLAGQEWFRTASPERRRQVVQGVREAAQRSAAQRAQVAAHPDLARRVCQILGLKHLGQWNGYVPAQPDEVPAKGRGLSPFDTSPVRRELLAVLHEAASRDGDITMTLVDGVWQEVDGLTGEQPCR